MNINHSGKNQFDSSRKPSTLLVLWVVLSLLLASCGNGGATNAPAATATVTLTATAVPTSTATPLPTVTPTPKLPVALGTLMPASSISISSSNLDQVVELARWGKGVISDIEYSPDGTILAVASPVGISIRKADSLEEILYIETAIYVNNVAFSPDGKTIAAALDDKTAKIWSLSDGSLITTFEGHTDWVTAVAFSADGTLLATGSADKTASVWKVSDGSLVTTIKGQGLRISAVTFAPDGQSLFTSSLDGTVRRTQISDGTLIRAIGGHYIQDMKVSADGTILAVYDKSLSYSGYGEIAIYQIDNGKKLLSIKGGQYYYNDIRSIALSPDGKYVAASWRDYTAKIWNVSTGDVKNSFEDLRPENYYYSYFVVAFSPDSQTLAMGGRNVIGMWDVASGKLVKNEKINSESVRGIAISPDEKTVASTEGTYVYLRQMPDGSPAASQEQIEGTGDVVFSLDGNSLAVGLWEQNAKLWPVTDQGVRQTFEMDMTNGAVRGLAFSPDGKIIALGNSPTIELRNVADGSLVRTINTGIGNYYSNYITDLKFSSDGSMLASAAGDTIKVFRVEDGKLLKTYNKGGGSCAFSPDGTLLAAGTSAKGLLQIWKVPDEAPLLKMEEPVEEGEDPQGISSLAFSPDGTLIFAGYYDGAIRVWQVSDGTLLQTWKFHSDTISTIVITSDGSMLITSSYDGTIRFWGLKP